MNISLRLLLLHTLIAAAACANRSEIRILNICSYGGDLSYDDEAYEFATEYVNNLTDFLNFPFTVKIDSLCALVDVQGSAMRKFIDGYIKEPNAALLLGPTFSNQAVIVGNVAKYYYLPQIGTSTTSPALANKDLFPYFSRVSVSQSLYLIGVLQILKRYNWTSVALMTCDNEGVFETSRQLEQLLPKHNITIAGKAIYRTDPEVGLQRLLGEGHRIFIIVRNGIVETSLKFECMLQKYNAVGPKYFWIQLGFTYTFSVSANGCSPEELSAGAENSIQFRTPTGITGNETSMGLIPISDLKAEFDRRYPTEASSLSVSGLAYRLDGLMAACLSLNATLQEEPYSQKLDLENSTFKALLHKNLRALNFLGFTGLVKLDENGDRLANVIAYQIRDYKEVLVANINGYLGTMNWVQDLTFAGGYPPRDRPQRITKFLRVSTTSAYIVIAFCCVGIAVSLCCIGVNFHYRNLRIIKLSSPNINNLMGAGCILCFISRLFDAASTLTQTATSWCWMSVGCLAIGFSVAYGSMLAKTGRVHFIFANKKLRRVAIKDWHLIAVVLGVVLLDILALSVWAIADPLRVERSTFAIVESIQTGVITSFLEETCTCNSYTVWSGIIIGVKGLLLVFGIFFAWETRNVHIESLNDSKQIGVCVYNTMVMGALGVALSFVLPSSEVNLRFLLVSFCVIICCSAIVGIVFGSKIFTLIKLGPNRVDDASNALPQQGSIIIGETTAGSTSGGT